MNQAVFRKAIMPAHKCFNCCAPLSECQCGSTQTYENDDGPVCPWCGALNRASDSDGALYSESIDEWECDHCGKMFELSVGISFSWSGHRPD
jgi:hypothetical protein